MNGTANGTGEWVFGALLQPCGYRQGVHRAGGCLSGRKWVSAEIKGLVVPGSFLPAKELLISFWETEQLHQAPWWDLVCLE